MRGEPHGDQLVASLIDDECRGPDRCGPLPFELARRLLLVHRGEEVIHPLGCLPANSFEGGVGALHAQTALERSFGSGVRLILNRSMASSPWRRLWGRTSRRRGPA